MSPYKTFPRDQVLPVTQTIKGSGEGGVILRWKMKIDNQLSKQLWMKRILLVLKFWY